MEASYQKYKGRINFRWVYGREGHPSDANHKGGSYELGWRHPDSVTKSMKDRAQRAVWMKTDPDRDYEIPMMIDFINDPPNKDDASRD